MTTTPAMTNERRLHSYMNCGRAHLTPAQHRRLRHKVRHGQASRRKPDKPVSSIPVIIDEVQQMAAEPEIIRGIERVTGEKHDPQTGEWMTAEAITSSIDAPRTMKLTQKAEGGRVRRVFRRKV